jgi:ABC-2 type transport system permease protein
VVERVVITVGFICSLLFVIEGLLTFRLPARAVSCCSNRHLHLRHGGDRHLLGIRPPWRNCPSDDNGMPMMMLSGGMSPIESQPQWVQYVTWFFPSRHYVSFMQAIVYRGANLDIVWKEFVTVLVMGVTFLAVSLVLFRRSVATLR